MMIKRINGLDDGIFTCKEDYLFTCKKSSSSHKRDETEMFWEGEGGGGEFDGRIRLITDRNTFIIKARALH